jgi:uncharacterized phage protein gp47/JayE
MKFEIDLSDVMGEEFEGASTQEVIKQMVVDKLVDFSKKALQQKIDVEVAKCIDEEIKIAIKNQMPSIIQDVTNCEYTPVDNWGQKKTPTTFRKQLLESISKEMEYKRQNYDSDKNVFTRTVDSVIKECVENFGKKFNKEVEERFFTEAVKSATDNIRRKLGIAG